MNRYYISDNRYNDGSISKNDVLIAYSAVGVAQFIIISAVDGFHSVAGEGIRRVLYYSEKSCCIVTEAGEDGAKLFCQCLRKGGFNGSV
jgi:hypothetical protein